MDGVSETAKDEANVQVRPCWQPCNTKFWYRRHAKWGPFFLVDVARQKKELAFNHEVLANALSITTGKSIEPDHLPIEQVDIKDNKLYFRRNDQSWVFDGELRPSDKVGLDRKSALRAKLTASIRIGEKTEITFVNAGREPLDYQWLDPDGRAVRYGSVGIGQSKRQSTYEGHIWQLVKLDGTIVNRFEAIAGDCVAKSDAEGVEKPATKAATQPEVSINGPTVTIKRLDGTTSAIRGILPEGQSWDEETSISPDGQYCILWERTPPQDRPLHIVVSVPDHQLQPKLESKQYLKPGDRIETFRPRLFDVRGEVEVMLDDKHFLVPFNLEELGWSKEGNHFSFVYNERGHQIMRVITIGPDGVKVVVEEKSETFIDYSSKSYFNYLPDSDELLWASEREGWNRLYLIDMVSGSSQPITPSNQVLYSVYRVDEDKRQLWYTVRGSVAGQDPYYNHLARVDFDGTNHIVLTSGDGTHSWNWSPDHKFLMNTWSRVDLPPITVLRNGSTGEELLKLEQGDLEPLVKAGWSVPERFEAPSRDGKYQIYGLIIKPWQFDPIKSYPIIERIYAGPHDQHAPKSFDLLERQHELANLGFIVVVLDGMGTNWRCKAFHDVCYKNIKDAGFPDRITWIKAAAVDRPWMDTSRVGIYGTSAGGQSAMGALLFCNDFYKVAVSDCGCHDNRIDKLWWNEQWMGWPVDESYVQSSNVVHAHKLEGKLMLMVGALDTNVDPSSTFQVVHALNKADKDYDLVVFPQGTHGVGMSSKYGRRRMQDFFCKHLLESTRLG